MKELLTLEEIAIKYPCIGRIGADNVRKEIMKWIEQNPKRKWLGDFLKKKDER